MSSRCIALSYFAGCLVVAASSSALAQPINDCADAYWRESLRCLFRPVSEPQPDPSPPSTVGEIKEYTQFPLSDPQIRCADGTRPVLYVDPAVGGPSNDWLITFTGGASCAAADQDQDGYYEDGQQCFERYFVNDRGDSMGTANDPAMKQLGSDPRASSGIHNPNSGLNPVFARYNRVRIEKCSWDQHNGRVTHTNLVGVTPAGQVIGYTLFQHGNQIAHLALETLRGSASTGRGISYRTWVDDNGQVAQTTERLPALESAEQVIVVAHSGSAHGLLHNIDGFADRMRSWPAFNGDIRAVLDASFQLAAENEVSFDPNQIGDLYDQIYTGQTAEVGAYDGKAYWDDQYARELEAWMADPSDPLDAMFDTSCVAAHLPTGDQWKCRDRHHVMFNHLTTPFFVREDFSDPVTSHTLDGAGHIAQWGQWDSYSHCGLLGAEPCPPLIPVGNPSPYRNRSKRQALTVVADIASRSELARGVDRSGEAPSVFFWMPDCGVHNGAYDDAVFDTQEIIGGDGRMTYRQQLEAFANAPAMGASAAHIDGIHGVSECRGTVFLDDFE